MGQDPAGIALSADGNDAYVTNLTDDTVSHVDLVSRAVVGSPIVVGDFPLAPLMAGEDRVFADGFDAGPPDIRPVHRRN